MGDGEVLLDFYLNAVVPPKASLTPIIYVRGQEVSLTEASDQHVVLIEVLEFQKGHFEVFALPRRVKEMSSQLLRLSLVMLGSLKRLDYERGLLAFQIRNLI